MTAIKTLKKISVKDLFGLGRRDDGAEKMRELMAAGHVKIFRIKGRVTGYMKKPTTLGESMMLIGNFMAQNLVTGEMFKAGKCYMSKDFTETVMVQFDNRGEGSEGIEFTAEVSLVKDSSSATGYTYITEPVETENRKSWEQEALKELTSLPAPEKPKLIGNGKK